MPASGLSPLHKFWLKSSDPLFDLKAAQCSQILVKSSTIREPSGRHLKLLILSGFSFFLHLAMIRAYFILSGVIEYLISRDEPTTMDVIFWWYWFQERTKNPLHFYLSPCIPSQIVRVGSSIQMRRTKTMSGYCILQSLQKVHLVQIFWKAFNQVWKLNVSAHKAFLV